MNWTFNIQLIQRSLCNESLGHFIGRYTISNDRVTHYCSIEFNRTTIDEVTGWSENESFPIVNVFLCLPQSG